MHRDLSETTSGARSILVVAEERMSKLDGLELYALAERLHRQFLDVVQIELDRRGIRDVNSVRAMIIYNIGDNEMTVSELTWRGCYLGSNVSYNLKKWLKRDISKMSGLVMIVA